MGMRVALSPRRRQGAAVLHDKIAYGYPNPRQQYYESGAISSTTQIHFFYPPFQVKIKRVGIREISQKIRSGKNYNWGEPITSDKSLMNRPALSVIIASYQSAGTLARTLASLRRQQFSGQFEVIVVDSSGDSSTAGVTQHFPEVRLFTFSVRKYPGDARNYGIAQAKSDLLAFIDADCVAEPDWVANIVAAHRRRKDAVIGGAVGNANPESLVGWAYYFCEFSQWMPGLPEQWMAEIPTCCLSLKRAVFEKYGPFLAGTYCSDSAFHWKLRKDGRRPRFVPSIRVNHINPTGLGRFVRHAPFHGRSFARVRCREQQFSPARRIFYVMISPLLPFLLFGRIVRRVLQHPGAVVPFARTAPLVFLGLAAWSLGEMQGYLASLLPRRCAKPTGPPTRTP